MKSDRSAIMTIIVLGLAVMGLFLFANAFFQPTDDSVVAKSSANKHEDYPESVVEELSMYRCYKEPEADDSIVEHCRLSLTLDNPYKTEIMLKATIKDDVIHYNDTPLKIGDTITYYQGTELSPKPNPSAIITINGVAVEHE